MKPMFTKLRLLHHYRCSKDFQYGQIQFFKLCLPLFFLNVSKFSFMGHILFEINLYLISLFLFLPYFQAQPFYLSNQKIVG